MFEKAWSALIEWKSVNDHMAYARFKEKFCNIPFNASTLSVDDRDKFYA